MDCSQVTEEYLKNNESETSLNSVDSALLVGTYKWYAKVKELMPQTEFFALSQADAKAIMTKNSSTEDPSITIAIQPEIQKVFDLLTKKLDEVIGRLGNQTFIRLGVSSAKDWSYHEYNGATKAAINDKLLKLYKKNKKPTAERACAEVQALYEASVESLKATNGSEALEILTRSERFKTDLQTCINVSRSSKRFPVPVLISKWVNIAPGNHIRVFVYKKKATGATQIPSYLFFKDLDKKQKTIEAQIHSFYARFKDLIPHECFVFDMALVGEETKQLVPILLNVKPLHKGVNTHLFDLKDPQDRKILTGQSPFEYRINKKLDPHIHQNALSPFWKNFFETKAIQLNSKKKGE